MTALVNTETGEIVELDQVAARRLTDKIKVGVEGVWLLIEQAYTTRAWQALGYKSWDNYTTREFGTSHLKLPREDRTEVIGSMRDAGLSIRAIVSATGISDQTVQKEIRQGVVNHYTSHTPEPADGGEAVASSGQASPVDLGTAGSDGVGAPETIAEAGRASVEPPRPAIVGIDGKTYPARQPKPQRRSPLTDQAWRAGYALRKKAESIERILADDRLAQNKEQISLLTRSDLLYVQRVVTAALEVLPITEG